MAKRTSRELTACLLQAALLAGLAAGFVASLIGAGGRALTFEDMMGFRQIEDPVISNDGKLIAFTARPDRGNPEVVLRLAEGEGSFSHSLGSKPLISGDSRWMAAVHETDLVLAEKEQAAKRPLHPGMLLLDLGKKTWEAVERVKGFTFSRDGRWLAYQFFPEEHEAGAEGENRNSAEDESGRDAESSRLILRDLASGREFISEAVKEYGFDDSSAYLALARSGGEDESTNGVYVRSLRKSPDHEIQLQSLPGGGFSSLTWTRQGSVLAWVAGQDDADGFRVWIWEGASGSAREVSGLPEGWYVPLQNSLAWTRDNSRLFFGIKPDRDRESAGRREEREKGGPDPEVKAGEPVIQVITEQDRKKVYDIESLLEQREMDIWHWNDPRIIPNQKKLWKEEKDRIYRATVTRADPDRVVQLADLAVPDVPVTGARGHALGLSQVPYMKEITWEGDFFDLYLVDLLSGEKLKIAEKTLGDSAMSPSGEFAAYFRDGDWYLYSVRDGASRNLTEGLEVGFADEQHDYPGQVPGYGTAGWLEDGSAVLIYDRFDIWAFPASGGEPVNMTEGKGRIARMTFRLIRTDPEAEFWKKGELALLSSYRDRTKNSGFYAMQTDAPGVSRLLEEEKKFNFLGKARDAGTLIYTREDYRESPDIWVSSSGFTEPRKVSDINPQVADYAWGEAELVEWNSLDGIPLQGVLIKPGNYEPGKRYPVLVYFYRFFSQRLHEFNTPVINHRPCFPLYASNGYAIFLPDIRFEIGRPGFSSTKCLVPGVQKLIDMGIADPKAIGLHGHSWSGYQTAFIVTQTDIFAAAVAGAPVSNMTSAYGGIRWGTGLSRQFQYEQAQSRIGGSLWEYPERYLENSPLFFADRINTPLLIMFGDEDDAVPWYQGIELYMAMRRLGRDAVFLQYRGEPHHLKKYPNRLDYAIRMKQYFDHYLKGAAAPDWIVRGEPYRGE